MVTPLEDGVFLVNWGNKKFLVSPSQINRLKALGQQGSDHALAAMVGFGMWRETSGNGVNATPENTPELLKPILNLEGGLGDEVEKAMRGNTHNMVFEEFMLPFIGTLQHRPVDTLIHLHQVANNPETIELYAGTVPSPPSSGIIGSHAYRAEVRRESDGELTVIVDNPWGVIASI